MNPTVFQLPDLYRPIEADLARVVAIMDQELQSELPFVSQLCERVRGYRGKMLRPALLLLSGQSAGGITPEHHTLAAVVELVHLATLVHDDVLDQAEERRRQATISSTHGNEAAVMLGDYLISHAFHLCSSLDSQSASRLVGHTTNVVCEGELMQIHSRGHFRLSEPDYIEIIRRKTAALTAACCRLGAAHAGADESLASRFEVFGESAGIAFQIVDDVLDVVGEQKKMGKTLGRDLELGKMTLPVIHYLREASSEQQEAMLKRLASAEPDDRAQVAQLLTESGSVAYANTVAEQHVARAISMLDGVAASTSRNSLISMAEFILQREN
ncbi:MAG: polyprenyl synthetase [Phycisphaerae bacterium]|nr:MAG: polyprenyl synthetase [Phycisphaerae bacterium]